MLSTKVALLIGVFTGFALAQEFRATLQGTIADPTQAAVPNAAITLKNQETGLQRDTNADGAGHYVFPFVVPGTYSMTVSAAGFKTTVRDGIRLSVNDNLKWTWRCRSARRPIRYRSPGTWLPYKLNPPRLGR